MCKIFASLDPAIYGSDTRSVRLNGQSTSVRLEAAFWDVLDAIAAGEGFTTPSFLSKLHGEVLEIHGEARNFTSLLRCICLQHLRRQADPAAALPAGRQRVAVA
jgi:predicted DNA-binding ribbon-helix-helix protein